MKWSNSDVHLFNCRQWNIPTGIAAEYSKQINEMFRNTHHYTGWPNEVSHYQTIKKSYQIVLKPVSEIRFIRQIKVWVNHYNTIRSY